MHSFKWQGIKTCKFCYIRHWITGVHVTYFKEGSDYRLSLKSWKNMTVTRSISFDVSILSFPTKHTVRHWQEKRRMATNDSADSTHRQNCNFPRLVLSSHLQKRKRLWKSSSRCTLLREKKERNKGSLNDSWCHVRDKRVDKNLVCLWFSCLLTKGQEKGRLEEECISVITSPWPNTTTTKSLAPQRSNSIYDKDKDSQTHSIFSFFSVSSRWWLWWYPSKVTSLNVLMMMIWFHESMIQVLMSLEKADETKNFTHEKCSTKQSH